MADDGKLRKHSNLSCFLRRTTPTMAARNLPKIYARDTDLHFDGKDGKGNIEYFDLADLWDNYYEWSVCGIAVPVLLSNGESVMQYYCPYLSAIQIFTSKFHPVPRNNVSEDSESDSWSDDSESEKMSRSWDGVSEDSSVDHDNSWTNRVRLGHLYLQFIERSPPHLRIPLIDKVKELARDYPGLINFKSADISPASWMSIAWYPIYHIPTRRSVKDLSACFLTYHTISSSFQDDIPEVLDDNASSDNKKVKENNDAKRCISLHPFGLATYKLHGKLWMNPETSDQETIMTFYNAADSWLKQLRLQHHDFNYFSMHSI